METIVQRSKRDMVREYLKILELTQVKKDLGFLRKVISRHVAAFAFSSVSCQLGDALPLDFASLFDRIVVRRRGGYCFEQNGLFFEILQELGFSPQLCLGRVIYNQDTHPGLTHRITLLMHEGEQYVVDVGFGPLGPRIPILLSENESVDGDRVFRIKEGRAGEYHMQVHKDGEFFSLYRFELARYGQADCEVGHFYSHRHENASFVNHLVVSLLLGDETRSLRNREYQIITTSNTHKQDILNAEQLRQILTEELGIQVTEVEGRQLYEGC